MASSVSLHINLSYNMISNKSQAYFSHNKTQLFTLEKPYLLNITHNYRSPTKLTSAGILKQLPKATLEEKTAASSTTDLLDEESDETKQQQGVVEESVKVLKKAAKTRKVNKEEVLAALAVIKKNKENLDPSSFLHILGGTESPGRTWMLIFTAKDKLKSGYYFPITAVQRFDAAAKRIQNGVYLGPIGCLTFEGRFSWKKRILAFIFEFLEIKIGPFGPLQISLGGQKEEREPSTKDPFFIWFYVDEEIAVAQGRGGGTALWCRCSRVTTL
ncbi:hypothetical protein BVC80_605g3 [Macleaya cordata]|uniref:Uncharacterized protein n=1 Tax=Macleaya cordata TaxID=56857 RepID=A0A200R0F0_MACCD|nr:hypothetical protein BVC80_605g3 [Macleaya cordata]